MATKTPAAATATADVALLGLHDRVALIQSELVDVPKNGHAEIKKDGSLQYAYDYVKEDDMMAALKPLLAKYRVACYVSMDDILVDGNMRTVRGSMTIACSHPPTGDGEFREEAYTIRASASGTDKGDKAIVKATTSVTRYLLQKGWLIETGGVDPEQENIDHERGTGAQQQQQRTGVAPANTNVITAAQRRKLMAEINDMGIPLTEAREVIAVSAGVLSTAAIKKADFQGVLGDLRGYAANPDAGRALIDQWRADRPDEAAALDAKLAEAGNGGSDG